jgi:hypothetical protein
MTPHTEQRSGLGPADRTPATDRRWTVLFIGDHGQVIAFRRIKTVIGLTVGVVTTALAAIAVLVVVNAGLHARTREFKQQMETAQLQIQGLRAERDRLTAHVLLVETKMKETLAEGPPAAAPAPEPIRAEKAIDRSDAVAAGLPVAKESAPVVPDAKVALSVGLEENLTVEAFTIGLDAARQTLQLRYKLVVTRPGRRPLAGHVVVVLKGEQLGPQQWLAMPRVDLPQGRPSGQQKGYTFSISHSKAFAHSMPAPPSAHAFTQAVLYAFSQEGRLWLAKDYSVDLKPSGG